MAADSFCGSAEPPCSVSSRASCSPRLRAPCSPRRSCSCARSGGIEHQPASDWIPLSAAPARLHRRLPDRLPAAADGRQRQFPDGGAHDPGVPDGQATQPTNTPPYCVGKNGTEGRSRQSAARSSTRATGVHVSVRGDPVGSGCMGAAGDDGRSFTVDTHVAPQLVGAPFAFRASRSPATRSSASAQPIPRRLRRQPLRARCHDPSRRSVRASGRANDPSRRFRRSARSPSRATGRASPAASPRANDSFARALFGTPWSAPLRFEVHSDFRREQATIVGPRRTRPTFDVEAEFAAASAGGKAT